MRIKASLCNLVLVVVVLPACTPRSVNAPMTSLPKTSTSIAISSTPSNTMTPTDSATPTVSPTSLVVAQSVIEDIEWETYVFAAGVSFEYPHEWFIMHSQEDSVDFLVISHLPYNMSVQIYEAQARPDPHSAVPNEGQYEVLWEKPISIGNAEGLEYIWGIPAENQIGGVLIAMYYSAQTKLAIILRTDADAIPSESNQFKVFEYIVQSVRFMP